jgi:hypothetical protein
MSENPEIPAFGIVDQEREHGILAVDCGARGTCRLTLVAHTERGYPRRELAALPRATWKQVATAVEKELLRGMDPEETGPKPPKLRSGDQALSPLVLRELAVLFWALMEDGDGTHIDALLSGWRQLAREERWWLYARASNPAQRLGTGWRRALYYALTDPADTRTAPRLLEIMEAATAQKKTSPPKRPVSYREVATPPGAPSKRTRRKAAPKEASPGAPPLPNRASLRKAPTATKSKRARQRLPKIAPPSAKK